MNQIQADKPSGAVSPAGSASPIANKPSAIPQSMLDKLKDVSDPVKKEVIAPRPEKARMPDDQLNAITENLASDQHEVAKKSVAFLEKNASKLHPDDLYELIKVAIGSKFRHVLVSSIPLIKHVSEICRLELYRQASGIMIMNDNDEKVRFAAVNLIKEFPKEFWYDLIEEALDTRYYDISFAVIPLIKEVTAARLGPLYGTACETINAALKLDNLRTVRYSEEAVDCITSIPSRYLRLRLIETALNNGHYGVYLRAIPLIDSMPKEHQPALHGLVKDKIRKMRHYDIIWFTSLNKVQPIKHLPEDLQSGLTQIALKSRHRDVRKFAQEQLV